MLTIRAEQLRVLARHALAPALLSHARDVAPDICRQMTRAHLQSVVDYCIARCERYGLEQDYDAPDWFR